MTPDLDAALESLRLRYAVTIERAHGRGVSASAEYLRDGCDSPMEPVLAWTLTLWSPLNGPRFSDVGVTYADALRGLTGYVDAFERDSARVPFPCMFTKANYTICCHCGRVRDPRGGNGPCGVNAGASGAVPTEETRR